MTNDKVNKALQECVDYFKTKGCAVRRFDSESVRPMGADALRHAHWMALEAMAFPPEKLEKKMRWLGFIQGTLFTLGHHTIRQLKEMNMPDDERG